MARTTSTAERITKAREKAGLTRYRLAKLSGIRSGHLHEIEAGLYEPKPSTLKKLAEHLGVDYRELME